MADQRGGGIAWTEQTWNPLRGCSRVSEGCRNCYAESVALRFSGPGQPYEGLAHIVNGRPAWTGKVVLAANHLEDPLRWQRPRMVFVNSMSDLFHESVPDQQIVDIFGIMALAHWHTYQILTKRPERMLSFLQAGDHGILDQFRQIQQGGGIGPKTMFRALDLKWRDKVPWQWPLPNVWVGVSVEDQATADDRIPLLLKTPAAVRWCSYEPALGPVNFEPFLYDVLEEGNSWRACYCDEISESDRPCPPCWAQRGLDLIVAGGESGKDGDVRPCAIEWLQAPVDLCKGTATRVFVKQLGSYVVSEDRTAPEGTYGAHRDDRPLTKWDRAGNGEVWAWRGRFNDRKGGDPNEWPEELRVRELPETPRLDRAARHA